MLARRRRRPELVSGRQQNRLRDEPQRRAGRHLLRRLARPQPEAADERARERAGPVLVAGRQADRVHGRVDRPPDARGLGDERRRLRQDTAHLDAELQREPELVARRDADRVRLRPRREG